MELQFSKKRAVRKIVLKTYKATLSQYSWKKSEGRDQPFPLYSSSWKMVLWYCTVGHFICPQIHTHTLTSQWRSDNNLAQILNIGLCLSGMFSSCPEHNIKLRTVPSLVISALEWSEFPVVLQYICVSHGCEFYVLGCLSSNQNSFYTGESHSQYPGFLIHSSKPTLSVTEENHHGCTFQSYKLCLHRTAASYIWQPP